MRQDATTLLAKAPAIRSKLAQRLPPKRFTHVMGVEGLALSLAFQWQVDPARALLAALLHDYMKAAPKDKLLAALDRVEGFPVTDEDRATPNVWHGLAAAQIAREEFAITDPDVLEAVFYHTTGVEGLGKVGLCLYVADTLEPTRTFPGVEEMRRLILGLPMMEAAHKVSRLKLDLLLHKHGTVHSHTESMKKWLATTLSP